MKESVNLRENVSGTVYRKGGAALNEELLPRGRFHYEVIRNGNVVASGEMQNAIVTQGKNSLLDVYFRNQTQLPNWYFGLVDNSGWTAFASGDTASSHAGWTEFVTYSEGTRQAWSPGAASSASITNGTVATFSITGTATLKGAFIISNSTKSGTSGTLWSEAAFSGGTVAVVNGDELRLTYTLSC